ncbi:glycosyl hydrolase [Solicola sp. PLA-1-18]|uniref:glycosyl hydrolase n=1 Tax=Solicola sp. PLA-1-18 TaxID=3380532 RepID=UPI003B7D52AF
MPHRALVPLALALVLVTTACSLPGGDDPRPQKAARSCVYTSHHVSQVAKDSELMGVDFDCVLVFNDNATSWQGVEEPWFTVHGDDDFRWDKWVQRDPSRTLVIAQTLIPEGAPWDWRERGAAGQYDDYFETLGRNLVRSGLGGSVIRLAHEGNGDWFKHDIGSTTEQRRDWATYWARAARILKSTPGSSFTMDLTVAAGPPVVPLEQWYPGDDVVDVIGADFYDRVPDDAPQSQPERWTYQRTQPGGLESVLAFAQRHDKPISVPEWGLAARDVGGAGDDPAFVRNMLAFVKANDTMYQGYWNKSDSPSNLRENPDSLAEYRALLGARPE